MPVVHTPESEYAKEMRKWEAHHTQYGPPGRPFVFSEYPLRMYKATRQSTGDRTFEAQTANNEHERRNLESRGFVVGGQQAALDALEGVEREHAELAANREWKIRHGRVGEAAVKEVRAAEEEAGARHLPDLPIAPKRRGRPKKTETPTAA
ncbi:MAG TPA: hypothetical protein VF573_27330 [Paraburkholderia sp.]|uniref:hypothetical protein n=1 Tax=Paraburkholderia sp. TaxID=1926495 RepID=UPI002ED4EED3